MHLERIEMVQNKYLCSAALKCGVRMDDHHRHYKHYKKDIVYDASFVSLIIEQIDSPNLLTLIKLNIPNYNV